MQIVSRVLWQSLWPDGNSLHRCLQMHPKRQPSRSSCRISFQSLLIKIFIVCIASSSETRGQLVGTTGFSWAKVYSKSGRAPGHLVLPNEFQNRLKSRLLIGQKNFFLANQRRGTAGRLSCLLTQGCFPHQPP